MTPIESLHYAIGELAYAVAFADGKIQNEEHKRFHDILETEMSCHDYDFDISDAIFKILERDKFIDSETAYNWAMKEIKLNSHYLSPKLKETFIAVLEKVAKSYPPKESKEIILIEKFKKEIAPIVGDPIYYG